MRKLFVTVLAVCMFSSATAAESQAQTPASTQSVSANEIASLLQDQAKERRIVALRLAPIKSDKDLHAYIQNNNKSSPLSALTSGARQRFIKSLTFNEHGLTSFQYTDLEAELTPSQIYQILSLFGAQDVTPLLENARIANSLDSEIMGKTGDGIIVPLGDHMDYQCVGRATCELSANRICMSSCLF